MFCLWSLLGVLQCHVFKSFRHFEFIFVYGERVCSNFMNLHAAVQFSQHHLLKRLSFSPCIFLPLWSKINWPYVCGFISGLSVLFHLSICLFLCQYHTVLITVDFNIEGLFYLNWLIKVSFFYASPIIVLALQFIFLCCEFISKL